MRRERIASVVTALALVLAAVGGGLGPVGTAQAQTLGGISNECYSLDGVAGGGPAQAFLSAAYQTITGIQNGCYYDAGSQSDYENVSKTDAYSSALGVKDGAESYTTTVQNFQENQRTVAYSKAKIAVVQALENGSGAATMSNDANVTVRDYYSRTQISLNKDYSAKLTQLKYLKQNTPLNFRLQYTSAGSPVNVDVQFDNTTITTLNGTTINTTGVHKTTEDASETAHIADDSSDYLIQAKDPADGSWTTIIDTTDYYNRWVAAEGQSQQVVDNMWQYAKGVESQYQAGDLNATTLVQNDPTLLAQEAGTSFNSTGYYGYSAAQLASIGYSGDLNQSHVIQINGANYTGTLFYSGADGTTFETGKSYQFDNFSGSFYLAASDTPTNQTGIVQLDDKGSSFTILEATNTQTGESVNETVTQKYVYESANATNLQQEIDRLEELREFYQEQASASGGVGINLGTEDKAIIGVIGAVVLVLALRD